MNDTRLPSSSIVATALSVLLALTDSEREASSEWTDALVSALSPFLQSPPPSDDLIAAPGASRGMRWHADQLVRLCQAQPGTRSPAERARLTYHARMLGHGLAPERIEFRPLVTILLPVHNRAGPLVEAVQSCMDQSWRPIEILVVDDGSTDDPAAALAQFGGAVRIVRKPNGGVASARNLGLRLARGDFIHLLDSDDLLCPAAIESKIAAFASVADADLCYGQDQWIDMRASPPLVKERHLRELANPIRSMIVEFAFTVPTVMMPRWRMLAMPPFEEDLYRSSDFRYWQLLGFAGIKAIGVRAQSAWLRRFQHSLQSTPHPHDDSHALALLRSLRDLFLHPHAWPYAAEYANILFGERTRLWFSAAPSERLRPALSELVAILASSCTPAGEGRLSMLPMLAALRDRVAQQRRRVGRHDENPACVYRILTGGISRAIERAAPVSDRDIAFWTRTPDAPIRYRGLHRFFASVARRCPEGDAAALADTLLRRSRRIPRRGAVRVAGRLRSLMGLRLGGAAVRWMEWRRG